MYFFCLHSTLPFITSMFQLQWTMIVVCVLHLFLRVSEKLVKEVFLEGMSEAQAEKFTAFLRSKSVELHVVSDSDQEKDAKAHLHNLEKKTFIGMKILVVSSCMSTSHHMYTCYLPSGRDCSVVLEHRRELLDLAFADRPHEAKRKADLGQLFESWADLWTTICTVDDEKDWGQQADVIDAKALAFASLFTTLLPAAQVCLYIHILVAHLADQVRLHGNLVKFSGQALEHLHAINKWIKRSQSTHHNTVQSISQIHLAKMEIEHQKQLGWFEKQQVASWIAQQKAEEDDGVEED